MAEFSISNIEISTPNKKRKKYSLEFKKEIALAAIKTNNLTVARDNDICESNVRLWRKDLPKIEQAIKDSSDEKNSAKKFRIDQGGGGSGKKPANLELEKDIKEKFMQDRSKGLRVTRENLMSMALQSPLAHEGFKASPGWCGNFLRRNGITSRQKTHQSQRVPSDYGPKIKNYFSYLRSLHAKKEYPS